MTICRRKTFVQHSSPFSLKSCISLKIFGSVLCVYEYVHCQQSCVYLLFLILKGIYKLELCNLYIGTMTSMPSIDVFQECLLCPSLWAKYVSPDNISARITSVKNVKLVILYILLAPFMNKIKSQINILWNSSFKQAKSWVRFQENLPETDDVIEKTVSNWPEDCLEFCNG